MRSVQFLRVARFVLLALSLALGSACTRRLDPQAALDHAHQTFRRGDVASAEKEAEVGYDRFHKLGPDWSWKFRLQQADALAWSGMYERVLALLSSEASVPPSEELKLRKQRLEGLAFANLHRFAEAEQALGTAQQSCAVATYPVCVDIALARGDLDFARGRYSKACGEYEQALSRARTHSSVYGEANALLSLSAVALQQEHFDEALNRSDGAFESSNAIGAESVAQGALGNKGWAYYKLGDSERAFGLFLEAAARARKIGAVTDQVKWLTTAGYVYLDSGEFGKAEQSYRQAREMAKETAPQDEIDALVSLATVSERTGKFDQARDYADQTIALVPKDGNRLDVLYPLLIKGHVAAKTHDTDQAEKIYREVEQDPKSQLFLKWEAEHSLAQLYEHEKKLDAAEREYRSSLNTFEGARYSLREETSSLPFPANAAGIYDDYIHFLVNQNKSNEALQIAEYQRGRSLAEGLGVLQKGATFKPEALDAQAIARKARGTILFYWLGERESYRWTITPKQTSIFTLPPKSQIESTAQRYRKALAEQQEFLQRTTDDGLALYRMLVEPTSTVLPHDGKVFIIPDGTLNTLNFETLLVPGSTPHYWIEDATITDASSLRLLAVTHPQQRKANSLLIVGNALAPNKDYPELRNAEAEIDSIDRHFPPKQEQVLTREQATPAAYLARKPEKYSYIHFVAHGTANRTSPLDSAIVLSRSSAQEDSFKLYARDIIHHPIHAELVTISTCYGAGARAYSGEGLVGLSWAFLRAGAHNVIGALWEVSDVSTPELMNELYSGLEIGRSPDTALRNAKLTLLRSHSYSKPFYWAPFQLYTGS
jgi:CHAT domain-containing protein